MARRRVNIAELMHRHLVAELAFWRRVGPEARLAAMWQMVREADILHGGDGNIPAMRRDIARLVTRDGRPVRRRLRLAPAAPAPNADERRTKRRQRR